MAERGAQPELPAWRRLVGSVSRVFSSPLELDHYIEMINPTWSSLELRGRVEELVRETDDATTVVIRLSHRWPGHDPGQYVRVGFEIDGIWNWRAYSLTSDPDDDRVVRVTPKLDPEGKVSPFVNDGLEVGALVKLGEVEGVFTLPEPCPEKLLFVTAGSGITPVMCMLRTLSRRGEIGDIVHIHSARDADDIIFGEELRALAARHEGLRLHERHTASEPRLDPDTVRELCPDWRERETFACGPAALLDTLTEAWQADGEGERLHMERFQPRIGGGGEGSGGAVLFTRSERETHCAGDQPILEAGEEAGLELAYGCRMGICHTCTGRLISGRLRDLRSGEVHGEEGQRVRICVNAPETDVEIEL